MRVQRKSARAEPAPGDGHRVLIDRLWPRGVSRKSIELGGWAKDLSPSTELRKWFGHDPERFDEFRRRYIGELRERREELTELRRQARKGTVTLLYGASDDEHNNAVVLAEVLKRGLPRNIS